VAIDPCDILANSKTQIPTARHHDHAVHHVIGRIRHRIRPRLVRAGPPPFSFNIAGCEKHVRLDGAGVIGPGPAGKLLATPAIAGVAAAGLSFGVFGGPFRRATKVHGHPAHHDPGGSTPVPEPSSALAFLTAVVISLLARRLRGRQ